MSIIYYCFYPLELFPASGNLKYVQPARIQEPSDEIHGSGTPQSFQRNGHTFKSDFTFAGLGFLFLKNWIGKMFHQAASPLRYQKPCDKQGQYVYLCVHVNIGNILREFPKCRDVSCIWKDCQGLFNQQSSSEVGRTIETEVGLSPSPQ